MIFSSAFTLIFLVIKIRSQETETTSQSTITKQEYDADKWIWSHVDVMQNKTNTTKAPLTHKLTNEENPCKKLETPPLMPNYRAPGKRIAEQKCEEYIWQVNNRIETFKLGRACTVAFKSGIIVEKYIKFRGCYSGTEYNNKNGPNIVFEAIGGRDALPGEFPHMGAIGWKAVEGTYIFKCGGILISSKFVLTAAHCTSDSRDSQLADIVPKVVRFGDKNIKDDRYNDFTAVTGNISRIIVHPDYKSPNKYNDIALIELEEDLVFGRNVQPACLWHQFDTTPLGKKSTATGWGVVKASSRNTSAILQVVDIEIIDSKRCDELLQPKCNRLWCGIRDTQICAGKLRGGVDACQGDSGGPLQVKIPLSSSEEGSMHYVIGITSFGFGCALENTPGVYTRVSPFLDWIESYVWK